MNRRLQPQINAGRRCTQIRTHERGTRVVAEVRDVIVKNRSAHHLPTNSSNQNDTGTISEPTSLLYINKEKSLWYSYWTLHLQKENELTQHWRSRVTSRLSEQTAHLLPSRPDPRSGRRKEHKPKLFGPGGGVFHVKGWGPKVRYVLETQ